MTKWEMKKEGNFIKLLILYAKQPIIWDQIPRESPIELKDNSNISKEKIQSISPFSWKARFFEHKTLQGLPKCQIYEAINNFVEVVQKVPPASTSSH